MTALCGPPLRPSTGSTCPRALAGEKCGARQALPCLCNEPSLDHPRAWTCGDRRVLTFEPYDVDGAEFAEVLVALVALGLEVTVSGASTYNPGGTFLIQVTHPRPPRRPPRRRLYADTVREAS